MQSLECMTAFVRAATGDVPPPLVGPSTTFAPPNHVYLFGGRTVSTRQVTASLYVLDLRTLVWTQIKPPSVHQPSTSTAADDDTPSRHITSTPENDTAPVWPSPRYFHTADTWQEKLIIFGGMGILPVDSTCFPSTAAPTAASSRPPDQPCVLADLWILDLATLAWSYHPADPSSSGFPSSSDPIPFLTQHDRTALPLPVPVARWSRLVEYWEEVRPSSPAAEGGGTVGKGLTFSRPRRSTFNEPSPSPSPSSPPSEDHAHAHAHDQDHVLAPHGDIYLFSNSNFTDVQRELYSITVVDRETTTTTDLTPYLDPGVAHTAPAAAQPPGLRFPFATQISHHLILGGTYLSQSTAQFAVWALNLVTWEWTKIDAQVLEGSGEKVVRAGEAADASSQLAGGVSEAGLSGGSWNRAVYWPRDLQSAEKEAENKTDKEQLGGQLLVFGNRYRNLQDDYEHRAINFDHVAVIELEAMQKRAGKVAQHRRQQSSGPAAVMTAGGGGGGGTLLPAATGGAPASEGDSARTVNGSTAGGSKEGDHHTYSKGDGDYALVEREEGGSEKPNMPSTAPPSATSPGKRQRMTSTASRSFSNTSDSETGTDGQVAATGGQARCMNASNGNAADSITDDLAAEVDEYSPPTYRTRRRSDSVASLHHFTNTRHEPIPHGQLVHRRAEPMPPHPPKPASRTSLDDGHRKRNQHRTRKMASMTISPFPNGTETGQHFVRAPPRPPPSSSFPVSRKAPMTMHFLPVTGSAFCFGYK
ncbi:hypothetical protein QFC19_006760 [Naganishia cerealis]|uniref:Uncharacterized protein n=1 Tax=Naganishia cerealis TaxID=610337 RepID=A0ACC2VEK6_9TREE|nr:hypothetical protein QFC19_006760 [Naganishia cerealis]